MLLRRLLQGHHENSGREIRRLGVEKRIVAEDQLGREVGQSRGTGDQIRGIPDGSGRGEAGEVGRLDVGEAPWFVTTARQGKRLEEIPGRLLIVMKPLRPVTGGGDGGGDGVGGAHPTDPSISRSMRRFNSTEYSIGNCWTRSLTKPFTARLMAAPSLRPRCCM